MRNRIWAVLALLALLGLVLPACDDVTVDVRGSGNVSSESRDVSGFDHIKLVGSGDVVVDVTGAESLIVEAEDNILPILTAEVRNGVLELGSKESYTASRGITYTITAEHLDVIEVEGSGDVVATGILCPEFDVQISGSGTVRPSGEAEMLAVDISGSGDYVGDEFEANEAAVTIGGSGYALVNATAELTVDIQGSGEVQYMGDPIVHETISGMGNVSPR
jgi:hypothetical protein